jgi:ABC-type nickel/cobalt efflux system permease component RcnA
VIQLSVALGLPGEFGDKLRNRGFVRRDLSYSWKVDTNSYVTFLVIGALLVVADGQIIYRNGRQFLQRAAPNSTVESMTKLVSVLFHIVVLGVLALISTIDVPADNATEAVVLRLGIVLIIIGIAHWIAVVALGRIRDREEFDEFAHEREARRVAHEHANAAHNAAMHNAAVRNATVQNATVQPVRTHQNDVGNDG